MNPFIGLLLLAHGLAHLPGFLVAWRFTEFSEMPYHTGLAGGAIDVGPAGIRIVGVGWLLAALGFWVAGLATITGQVWSPYLAAVLAAFSLVLCIIELPAARIGIFANLVILIGAAIALRTHWFG